MCARVQISIGRKYVIAICLSVLWILCTVTVHAEPVIVPKQVLDWQQSAKAAIQNKDYTLAEQEYQKIVQLDADSPDALDAQKMIAVMHINVGDYSKADTAIAQLHSRFANAEGVIRAVGDIGRSLRQKKQHTRAIEIYRDAIQRYSSDDQSVRLQGAIIQSYFELKDRTSVDAEFTKLLEKFKQSPAYVEVVSKRAKVYLKLKDPAKAQSICQQLLQRYPNDPGTLWAHDLLIRSHLQTKDKKQAITQLDALLNSNPVNPACVEVLHELGWALGKRQSHSESLEIYNHLLSRFPDHQRAAWVQRAKVTAYLLMDKVTEAEAELENLFTNYKSQPSFVPHARELAVSFRNHKHHSKAIDIYTRLLTDFPDHKQSPRIQGNLIRTHLTMRNLDQAEAATEVLFTAHTVPADAFMEAVGNIQQYYRKKNDYGKVLELCSRALKVYPDHARSLEFQKKKAGCYLSMNARSQADGVIDALMGTYQGRAGYFKTMNGLAGRYRKHKHYAKSFEIYQQLMAQNPGDWQQLESSAGMAKALVHMPSSDNREDMDTIIQLLMKKHKDADRLGFHLFQIGEEYYFRAEEAVKNGNQEQSTVEFQKAIAIWQKNIHQIADSKHECLATYYSAIAYQYMSNYAKAIDYYQQVIDRYPQHEKAWQALYSITNCYDKLVDLKVLERTAAKQLKQNAYKELVEKYPDCIAAKVAAKKLRML